MQGINLIVPSSNLKINIVRIQRLLFLTAVILGISFFIAGTVIFYLFSQTSKTFSNNKEIISSLEKEITNLNKNESYLTAIGDRLTKIEKILKERYPRLEIFNDIKHISVPGFFLAGFEFKATDEDVRMEVFCSDSQCLSNLSARVEDLVADKRYSLISFLTIGRDKTDKFNLSLEFKK